MRTVRPLARRLAVALVVMAAAGCGPAEDASPGAARDGPPDVVVIVMDTVRADHCSLYGYPRPTTPELERWAQEAVTYAQAWSPSRWTVPSHASLFTGLRPRHHGARPSHGQTLYEDVPTLAERLAAAGWATGAFVSNPAFELQPGLYRGFDAVERMYGLERRADDRGPLAPAVHDAARTWVRAMRARKRPFFLFVNDVDPHSPYQPLPEMERRFVRDGVSDDELLTGRSYWSERAVGHNFAEQPLAAREIAVLSDLYDAEIAGTERDVVGFLETLAGDGLLDNALVVVTSDHGEYFGEHGLLDHMQGVHQAVLRVPLVVRYPDGRDAGRRVEDVVRLEDVTATVLDVCGVPGADGMDGMSLRADLPGRVARGESYPNSYLVASAERQAPAAVVRRHLRASRAAMEGTWRLIVNDDGTVELYDHRTDPAERHDVSAAHADVVERMRALIDPEE